MPTTTERMTAQELTQQQARRSSEDDARTERCTPSPTRRAIVVWGIKKDTQGH